MNTMTTNPMPLEWVVVNNRTMKALRCNYNPKTGIFSSQRIPYEEATSFNAHGKETAD